MVDISWDPMKEPESTFNEWSVSVIQNGEVVWDSGVIISQEQPFVRLPDFLVPSGTVQFKGKRLDVDNHE